LAEWQRALEHPQARYRRHRRWHHHAHLDRDAYQDPQPLSLIHPDHGAAAETVERARLEKRALPSLTNQSLFDY
jgi:hypothetical protein